MTTAAPTRPGFHLMAKPSGAACNLDCHYCFYLEKTERLGQEKQARMDDATLEAHIRQTIAATDDPEVQFAWQGGEPTLMGLDFFRRVIAIQEHYRPEGRSIVNTFQTNGVLLDDEWCAFLAGHKFLVGLSVALCPSLVYYSHVMKEDTALTLGLCVTVAAIRWLLDAQRPASRLAAVAGVGAACALAASGKYHRLRN